MPTFTLSDVFSDARGLLNDTQVAGGELFTNSFLPVHFAEPYRTMFSRLAGSSRRVQRAVYVVLPASTSILIPSTAGILDMTAPELVEERPATTAVTISSTNTTSPILVTAPAHGQGAVGGIVQGVISGVLGTTAPWGMWFATVVDANTLSLRGSASDGVAGTGGAFYPASAENFTEVWPSTAVNTLDGVPRTVLGNYVLMNSALMFAGAANNIMLRITYYASGSAPTNPNYTINIDNARDFLAFATAANAAASKGWRDRAEGLRQQAYGVAGDPTRLGLLETFTLAQVLASQGEVPPARQLPFRSKRSRFGSVGLG